ncbi:MAG: tetratricopeptide repeat protein, partial [Pseudohongiellaceae bacterium]
MKMLIRRLFKTLFSARAGAWLLVLNLPLAAIAAESVIDELSVLIAERRYQEAYLLAQDSLLENEGLPEFDFLYGLAALETAHPDEAVFAFERIAYTFPDQRRVKLELARAYYMSNNLTAAANLFNEVLETNPEPNVEANINAFLTAIEDRQNQVESTLRWFVNSSIGSDSNINSATELNVIPTPIGDVELNPSGQSIDDEFMNAGGGLVYTWPLDKNRALSFSGNLNRRNNFATSQFDLDTIVGEGSYISVRENHRFT